jgi:hypothetical protein
MVYLDPHTTLDAVSNSASAIAMKHTEFHEKTAKKIHFTKLDPSLCFGFYLKTPKDYVTFENFMLDG